MTEAIQRQTQVLLDATIVVPTYNERDNVVNLCEAIDKELGGEWQYELIFVDDNSPDGTADLIATMTDKDSRIHLIQRPKKLGLASAVVAGFQKAQGRCWLMMDADLSHNPRYLPEILQALSRADIVVGSRYIPGGGVENWPIHRRVFSRFAAWIGRALIGIGVKDLTSGFAAFRRQAVEPMLPHLDAIGFKLVLEILAKNLDGLVEEVPIVFTDRVRGESKFSLKEVLSYLKLCLAMRVERKRLVKLRNIS